MRKKPIAAPYSQETGYRFNPGALAYFDSFAGMVPCKVKEVAKGGPHAGWMVAAHDVVTAVVTAKRGSYRKGEVLKLGAHQCVPRPHVVVRSGQYRVRTNYSWCEALPAAPK